MRHGREEAGKLSDDVDTELDNGGWVAVLPWPILRIAGR